jgi:GTP pyrophosphokinase
MVALTDDAKTIPGELQSLFDALSDLTPHDRNLIERAYRRAAAAHEGVLRRSGDPYITHCLAVAHILADLHMDAETIAAALLHDTLEDTSITYDVLRSEFGKAVANIVDGVTKLARLPEKLANKAIAANGRNNPRDLESIRKMMLAMNEDVRVVLVKLADRLHNMRTLSWMKPDKQQAIAQETLDIFAPLANRLGIWQFKWELEDLSLRFLHPETYKLIANSLDERRADREADINRVLERIRTELARYGLGSAIVSGRPKHIYSIWKKMQRKNVGFEKIYDVRAVRIIVDEVPQCYLVLGVIHNIWRPIPSEFDDYIAAPKDNFYRSLHTAVVDDRGRTLEVQIRTMEMHQHAEYGIAAHWRYKEGGKGKRDEVFEKYIAYIRGLMEFGKNTEDPVEFVAQMKQEVFQSRVYVFTPKGDVVDLMAGATPVDFAYHIHTDIGHRCRSARVNGQIVPLDYKLKTGDQVEIVTAKRGGPSRDWLNEHLGFCHTARAREKIRYWFRKQNRESNIAGGREVLERELRQLGLMEKMSFQNVAALFNFDKLDDFLALIGAGDISPQAIGTKILERENQAEKKDVLKARAPIKPLTVDISNGVDVLKTDGVLVNIAQCCHPMYGDKIIGYVTRGHGVTVHRADCKNAVALQKLEADRLVDVDWALRTNDQTYEVPIEITAYDREGLMMEVSALIANQKVNMTYVKADVNKEQGIAILHLKLQIHSPEQLMKVLTLMRNIRSVTDVKRINQVGTVK